VDRHSDGRIIEDEVRLIIGWRGWRQVGEFDELRHAAPGVDPVVACRAECLGDILGRDERGEGCEQGGEEGTAGHCWGLRWTDG